MTRFQRSWLPWVGLLLSLAMGISTWYTVWRAEQARLHDRLRSDAALNRERIRSRMAAQEQILRGAAEFFSLRSELPSREEWRNYVQALELDRRNPGVQALAFAEWVPLAALDAHVRRLRAEGFPDYKVQPGGPLAPEGGVSSIIYIEPFDERNQQAFSRDMYAEPVRRAAMARARDTGQVTLSGKVKLYQETATRIQAGTLLYAPVYRQGLPLGTVVQRRQAFLGWAYMPFRMDNLMKGILGATAPGIFLELFDGESEREPDLLYTTDIEKPDVGTGEIRTERFEVAGRVWTLRSQPQPSYGASSGEGKGHTVVLLLGLFGSGAIFLLFFSLVRAEHKAATVADEHADRLRLLLDSTAEAIYGIDLRGDCTFCNPACLRILGYEKAEQLLGRNMHELIHYAYADGSRFPADKCRINQVFREGTGTHVEDEVLWRADGSPFPAEYWSFPQYREGKAVGAVVTFLDITERTRAEQKLRESENNFRTFFETVDDVIVVGTPEGRLLFANAAATDKLGYTPEELRAMTVLDLHPPEKRSEAGEIFGAMFRKETDFCPLPLGTREGALVPVETRIWFGKWDGLDCIFGISKDLRKQEAALQKFDRFFRNNPVPMAVSNLDDNRYSEVNDAFLSILGYSRDEVIGHTGVEIGLFPEPEKRKQILKDLESTDRFANVEIQVRARDGRILDGLFSGEVVDNQGQRSLLTVMIDLTEQRRGEAEIRRQQAMIRSLLDSIPDIIFFKDNEGVYLGCNPPFAEFVGRSREEIVGRTDYDLFGKEIADFFRENDRLMLQRLQPRHNEEWITYPDGRKALLDTLKTPYYGPAGEVVGILGISRDITFRHKAEQVRKEAEAELKLQSRLQQMLMEISSTYINLPLEATDFAIHASLGGLAEFVGADRTYVFLYDWEKQTCSNTHEWCAFGIEPHIADLQDVPLAVIPDWVALHRMGQAVHIPDVNVLPPGALRDTLEPQSIRSLLAVPMISQEECIGFVGFDSVRKHHEYTLNEQRLLTIFAQMLVSVRQRKAAEEALREANRSLEETTARACVLADQANAASVAKSEFLANMSHEIRTPMNGVLGMLGLLLDTELAPKQRQYAETAWNSSRSLLALINDILDLSRVEAGRLELEEVNFDLRGVLDELVLGLSPQAREKGLQLYYQMAEGAPRYLVGDPFRLKQVLLNLAGNAIKFTAQGEVAVLVEPVAAGAKEATLRFRVRDTGIGIPPHKRNAIFQSFTQADASITRKYGGSGLGLTISRKLVALLGGDVGLESEESRGSEFFFTARFRPQAGEPGSAPAAGRTAAAGKPDFRLARLLLVEDNAINQAVALAALERWGIRTDVASNGREALEALRKARYDLVLMDVQMPEMDGFEATATLRDPSSGVLDPRVPVVAMTAHAMHEDRQRCLDAGMNDYLSKPIEPAEMERVLTRYLPSAPESETESQAPPPESEASGDLPVFERKALPERLLGDEALAAALVRKFMGDAPALLAQIRTAADSGEKKTLHRILHTLKGSAATMGAPSLSAKAAELESMLQSQGPAGVAAGLPALEDEFERLREAIAASLDPLAK